VFDAEEAGRVIKSSVYKLGNGKDGELRLLPLPYRPDGIAIINQGSEPIRVSVDGGPEFAVEPGGIVESAPADWGKAR
jgi:hypothetical protein